MFNTDDKLIQGCMFLSRLIFFAYGAVMMFNTDFMMERYPTFENNQTTVFFVNWFGAVNFVSYVGIFYMGFKGLDRGSLLMQYLLSSTSINNLWIIMSQCTNWRGKHYRSCSLDNSFSLACCIESKSRNAFYIR